MSLQLYYHPLSSYCHKVLIALYENGTAFEPRILDGKDEAIGRTFKAIWPVGKFPVLHDTARGETLPESSIIIEYLDVHRPGRARLIPDDPDLALGTRLKDRFYDLYVHQPMQKVIGDRLRPPERRDPHGVDEAQAALRTAYAMIDKEMATKTWVMGDAFTLADCAAAPPLFFARYAAPIDGHRNIEAYLARLMQRPSYARALKEAEPFLHLVPKAA